MLLHRFAKRNRRCKLQKIYEEKNIPNSRERMQFQNSCKTEFQSRAVKCTCWGRLQGDIAEGSQSAFTQMSCICNGEMARCICKDELRRKCLKKKINCTRQLQLILQTKKKCGRKYNFIAHLKFIQIISKSRSIAIANYENESQCKNLRR